MKHAALLLLIAMPAFAYEAQGQAPATPAKPATAAGAAKKPGTAATPATGIKLPPGVPVVKGVLKTAFALRYEDVKLGTGAPAEPGKLYKVHYTGWLATDGKKFDSSFDHRRPVMDKDGQPEKNADGTPKMGDPEPIQFPQGRRGVIPGWDQGFGGMKVGGKRRLFIPYQLAYGEQGRPPVIPPKSDLIFDIELVDVSEMPTQGTAPRLPPGGRPGQPASGGSSGTPAPPTGSPAAAPPTPPPATPAKPTDPTAPTVVPNSAPAPAAPAPTQPAPKPATAPPDKPANPAQPN